MSERRIPYELAAHGDSMELDVTAYVTEHDCSLYSDSVANSGLQNIGEITWNNAKRHVAVEPLVQPEDVPAVIDWLLGFGAWDREELEADGDAGVNALLLQFIAGDVSIMESFDTYAEYEDCGDFGRLYRGDAGQWLFYVGD